MNSLDAVRSLPRGARFSGGLALNALGRNASGHQRLTRIRMDVPGFDALRLAFEDGDARVRIEDQIPTGAAENDWVGRAIRIGGFFVITAGEIRSESRTSDRSPKRISRCASIGALRSAIFCSAEAMASAPPRKRRRLPRERHSDVEAWQWYQSDRDRLPDCIPVDRGRRGISCSRSAAS